MISPALQSRFPRTTETLASATIDHLLSLEDAFRAPRQGIGGDPADADDRDPQFDVLLAGGGLSLIYGAYLARRGLRVAIFDRRRVGSGHREWNVSRQELQPLIDSGLFDSAEVDRLVLHHYDHGIVRWHGGRTYAVRDVLDCVVDAEGLLGALRRIATTSGAAVFDEHRFIGCRVGDHSVCAELESAAGRVSIRGRLLLDGMGASSPNATYDLVCPTVGGVLEGLTEGRSNDEIDPRVGEILVSTEGVEEGRQHIWEGFPGPDGRYTIYLFYYAEPDTLGEHPLLSLYERFFRLRARYKRGDARFLRPTYGFIPAYTRLRPTPTATSDRVLLVGDAASRHSPITFCGFGSMVRSFLPVSDAIIDRLARDRLSQRALASVWREPPGLRVMGGLTLMMIPSGSRGAVGPLSSDEPTSGPDEVNRLLDAAFGSLAAVGEAAFASFIRDEIGARDFLRFMIGTSRRRPSIYREVFQHLTPSEIGAWSRQLVTLAVTKWRSGQ